MSAPAPPNPFEKVLYLLATLIVLAVAGAAILLDLTGPKDPHPRIEARMDGAAWEDGTARAIPWIVENVGSQDLEQVLVETRVGERPPVSQEIDYLPRGASRRGVARVPADGGAPVVEVAGYRLP